MATSLVLSPDTDPDDPSDGSSMGVYFAPKSFHYSSVGGELTKNAPRKWARLGFVAKIVLDSHQMLLETIEHKNIDD